MKLRHTFLAGLIAFATAALSAPAPQETGIPQYQHSPCTHPTEHVAGGTISCNNVVIPASNDDFEDLYAVNQESVEITKTLVNKPVDARHPEKTQDEIRKKLLAMKKAAERICNRYHCDPKHEKADKSESGS